jgi:hypothetical protein
MRICARAQGSLGRQMSVARRPNTRVQRREERLPKLGERGRFGWPCLAAAEAEPSSRWQQAGGLHSLEPEQKLELETHPNLDNVRTLGCIDLRPRRRKSLVTHTRLLVPNRRPPSEESSIRMADDLGNETMRTQRDEGTGGSVHLVPRGGDELFVREVVKLKG